MIPHLFYYQLLVLGLLWLFGMLSLAWPSPSGPQAPQPTIPSTSRRTRGKEPQPFGGLTHKPLCVLCDQEATHPTPPPPVRPDPMPPPHRRPRAIDTARHFCPHTGCAYRGWLGLGNLRANGHPSGGQWRQFHCTACQGYFPEHHGTLFHGKRVSVDLLVHVIGCLAEGLGIRGTARVFEIDPNTVLSWLMEAADQLRAFWEYLTALLTHYGQWVQPPRRQAQGPAPKPRWMPLPQLLYAQVVKTVRRRRLVDVQHRVVFGTLEAINAVLAPHGWHINTAFVEVRPVDRKWSEVLGWIAMMIALYLSC